MKTLDLSLVGPEHVRRYQETDGAVGHDWNGAPCLILTTRGRRSGEERAIPLIYGRDGERFIVVASKGGAPTHPAWYRNLAAEPRCRVQVRADCFDVAARVAHGEERERLWTLMARVWPSYDQYAARTQRQIPVVVLERAGA
jgi:deazaflavin-dependent oxidoreductase (nitroreductase family)